MTTSASSETAATPRVLDGIRSPADVKALDEQDLPQLAQEVREELIKVLSQTGGHLGPNLGVVELTIALHRVFETPKDRLPNSVHYLRDSLDKSGSERQIWPEPYKNGFS